MALFKINKGLAENLAKNMPYAKEGFAYFTKDDGKFYIDIAGDGTTTEAIVNVNRIPLNAAKADVATMIQATAMATDDSKVYPILAFNITDSTKNLVEAKYSQIGIKNGTLVIPSVEDKDEILISNEGLGRGIVIDNKGTNNAIEILNGKGIKVAQDPTDDLELTTKQYVDNQNVVLELNMAGSTYWTDQTSYDFILSAKAQAAYSRLIKAIEKGYIPTVIINDIDNIYIYKYSFTQNLILTALLVFTVEIPLSNDGNHIGKDFIAFQSNVSGTTLTVQRLNKPLEYIPGGGKVNQILSVSNNGQATWLDIPNIEDLGGATKNHTHDDRYYTENEINDKLNAINDKIGALLGANDALVFKGIIDGKHPLPTANYKVGHTYRVNEAGTYAGQKCEQGDLIICIVDALSTNTPHWTVAQTNIDGAVTGPDASTVNAVSTFADATGKVIKDNPKVTIDNIGLFTAPYIATGTDKTHYFQSRKFRGEGDADTYYHAIDFGYSGHNQVDFHEYGGIWNFYENTKGTVADGKLVAQINKQGFIIPGVDTTDRYFRATNSNGSIGLLTSTNQGLYDYTNSKWILYHSKFDGINYFNGLATKATQDKNGLQIDTNYLKLSGGTMSGKITFKFTTSKPAKGTRLPVLSGQYQNGSGAYYSTDLVDMIGTASTNVHNAAVRFGSTNGATFITSGEGGCVFPSKLNSNLVDCENISFCADGGFNFWGNISNDGSTYTSYMNMSGTKITAYQPLYGAVWNDYAEFREGDTIEAGHCVIEVGDDTLITSTERLMPGANITSDTFGFSIGETEQAKTPIAVSGRVLAYPYESREEFKKNIGRPVCSGPNGTVSIMTDEEYRDKGYCAIGTISAVPDYEEWGTGKVKVNGRVWIKVF